MTNEENLKLSNQIIIQAIRDYADRKQCDCTDFLTCWKHLFQYHLNHLDFYAERVEKERELP